MDKKRLPAWSTILFLIGKFLLSLYLVSGAAGSPYGAAGSLVTLLLWVFYSGQILLFGAEFTKVYANACGSLIEPEEHAVKVVKKEIEISPQHEPERAKPGCEVWAIFHYHRISFDTE
jgi:membrane protein